MKYTYVKFTFKFWKFFTCTYLMLQQDSMKNCLNCMQHQKWFLHFNMERTPLKDNSKLRFGGKRCDWSSLLGFLVSGVSPCIFLFPKLTFPLKGHQFQMMEEIEENVLRDLNTISQKKFKIALQNGKRNDEKSISIVEESILKKTFSIICWKSKKINFETNTCTHIYRVSQKFCGILVCASLWCIYCMTEVIQRKVSTILGYIVGVRLLIYCILIHSMCDLKTTQIKKQYSIIHKLMLNKF